MYILDFSPHFLLKLNCMNIILQVLFSFTVIVQIEKAPLKKQPDFLSENAGFVKFGGKLEAMAVVNDWYRILYKNKTYFIHSSAVEKKKVKLQMGKFLKKGHEEEVVSLAAKGFSENDIKRGSGYNSNAIKYIEKFKVGIKELKKFKEEGDL